MLDFLAVGRRRGPGRDRDLRRPDAAGPARRRAGGRVRPARASTSYRDADRDGPAAEAGAAVGQGRRIPAVECQHARASTRRTVDRAAARTASGRSCASAVSSVAPDERRGGMHRTASRQRTSSLSIAIIADLMAVRHRSRSRAQPGRLRPAVAANAGFGAIRRGPTGRPDGAACAAGSATGQGLHRQPDPWTRHGCRPPTGSVTPDLGARNAGADRRGHVAEVVPCDPARFRPIESSPDALAQVLAGDSASRGWTACRLRMRRATDVPRAGRTTSHALGIGDLEGRHDLLDEELPAHSAYPRSRAHRGARRLDPNCPQGRDRIVQCVTTVDRPSTTPPGRHRPRTEALFRRPARSARATSCSRAAATATPTSRSSRCSRIRPRPASCAASGRPRSRAATATPLVDLVAGPTTGGVILAFETARQLGVRAIFAEEVRAADGDAHREFRRGFRIEPGERVLLVDDILTTGGSLLAMLPAVEAMGGEIVECVVAGRPERRAATLTSPRDRAGLPAPLALAAGPADLRARPGDLPALRRRDAALRTREHRDTGAGRGTDGAAEHGPRARTGSSSSRSLVIVIVRSAGAAILLGRGRAGPGGCRGAPAGRGVIVADRLGGPDEVHGFDLRTIGRRRRSTFAHRQLENGAEFPPGHLAEHQATASPVRVWYRTEGGVLVAIRARGRRALAEAAAGSARRRPATASSSASRRSRPRTSRGRSPRRRPRRSTARRARPHSFVAGAACSWPFASSTGWSWPSDVLQLVRLDVDERHVGVGRRDRLEPVERRAALRARAELRRREDEHERLVRRERVGDRGLVEGRIRVRVGRDLREVAADVGQRRGVRGGSRLRRPATVGVESADLERDADRLGRASPGASVVNSAPHCPAAGRSALTMYMPRSSSIVHMNSPSAVDDRRGRVWRRGRRRPTVAVRSGALTARWLSSRGTGRRSAPRRTRSSSSPTISGMTLGDREAVAQRRAAVGSGRARTGRRRCRTDRRRGGGRRGSRTRCRRPSRAARRCRDRQGGSPARPSVGRPSLAGAG